ncbi:AbrB/MazE/SpoVT family DNA-binding domain-containing protein [Thermosulfurimonas sp. F29]|uniref:AbrB/MazE/SpoVT family DNA-binding domain-containing protein n=1 Tax=Thermosulfurimonas sp. F29 TaxID=2867247 RepID=UPI001C8409C5|nr:AbrB/MazE/SpoVT family DNA-binding domain-containing protein [Thermosulfurimonas sp. F29]MBX6423447.1 AbrB/MazE/SpoVT family DNA-binding domain-containing protein [Thermosulfurimonas sp. F29]
MVNRQEIRIGKRGVVVIPAELRKRYKLEEGDLLLVEAREDGILLRKAVTLPVEVYSPERKAEFLLSTALDPEDYQKAREEVRKMGLNPDAIPHIRPED